MFRSKTIKNVQKARDFTLPILTFWASTPSGASARAVLPLRKGSKTPFSGRAGAVKKLSTGRARAGTGIPEPEVGKRITGKGRSAAIGGSPDAFSGTFPDGKERSVSIASRPGWCMILAGMSSDSSARQTCQAGTGAGRDGTWNPPLGLVGSVWKRANTVLGVSGGSRGSRKAAARVFSWRPRQPAGALRGDGEPRRHQRHARGRAG